MITDFFKQDKPIIIWDTETEGLCKFFSRPFQIGFLIVENNKIIKEYESCIKWDLKISKDAARVTKFDEKHYKEHATQNKEILDIFESYLYNPNYYIMGMNILSYDSLIHNTWRRNLGFKSDYSWLNRLIDIHPLAKGAKLEIPYNRNDDFLAYQFRMSSIKKKGLKTNLGFLAKENKIELDENKQHSGLYDCHLVLSIWNKWLKNKLEGWLMIA